MPLPTAIHNELIDGLTLLDNLSLAFAPRSLDDLKNTAAAWEWTLCAKITWDEGKDVGRLMKAFAAVAPQLEKWPSPALIIQHLPPRPPPPALPKPKAVPCPPEIAELLNSVNEKLIVTK